MPPALAAQVAGERGGRAGASRGGRRHCAAAARSGAPPSRTSRAVGVSRSGPAAPAPGFEHAARARAAPRRRARRRHAMPNGSSTSRSSAAEACRRRRRRARSRAGPRTADRPPPTRPRRRAAPRRASARARRELGRAGRRDGALLEQRAHARRASSRRAAARAPTDGHDLRVRRSAPAACRPAPRARRSRSRYAPSAIAQRPRDRPRAARSALTARPRPTPSGPATLPARSTISAGPGGRRGRDRDLDLGGGEKLDRRRVERHVRRGTPRRPRPHAPCRASTGAAWPAARSGPVTTRHDGQPDAVAPDAAARPRSR